MKHTPWLWSYRAIFNTQKSWYDYTKVTADMANVTIAVIQSESMEQDEANARLIAAAPELLEACKAVSELDKDIETIPYPLKVRFRMVCHKAEQAIAKAEGRDQ